MLLDFRIDFGYQMLYTRKHYHPVFVWDGHLECENGEIVNSYLLEYPYLFVAPGLSAKKKKIDSPCWEIRTKREFKGVSFEAEVNDNTIFHLKTASCDITFSAKDLIEKGALDITVGPKYLNCSVVITKKDYLWFRNPLSENEVEYPANALGLPVHDWARMRLAFLEPGQCAKWEYEVKNKDCDVPETLFHLVAMAAPKYTDEGETPVKDNMPLEIFCDGKSILKFEKFYRWHGNKMQILDDEWRRLSIPDGKHTFELKNNHGEYCIAIFRITMKPVGNNHAQLSIPKWAICGEEVIGKVFAAYDDEIEIKGADISLTCKKGWNEFKFTKNEGGVFTLETEKSKAEIEIYDEPQENPPVKVGYDMTTIPHDDNGLMDWLLDYTYRTRLGNYVVFRNFGYPAFPIKSVKTYDRYGKFCKEHKIHCSICREIEVANLKESAGEMLHDAGKHEFTGKVYAFDPTDISEDMKEATEKFTAYVKAEIDETRKYSDSVAFGDASGGVRHTFIAGADFVRAETMVGHTTTLLSQVRPAAEALGKGTWGVHIAIHHGFQPHHEIHLGQYFLSLMQPWMMGANVLYEEDSLFALFKEERQSWDDYLTRGKRDMTRNFFKFAKTHSRRGKNVRKIAFLEGRYAAPFNGFICDYEQDPHYSVWGYFGNPKKEWGHASPEKCRQLLDVLMPGASTHPLRQKFDKRRFFFSGSPYGEFDCTPIEANGEYFDKYKLLLNLGWNTALTEDLDKLKKYVENGGVLLTGIPQFSTHVKRDFLSDMSDLALIRGGDLSDICGIKVKGAGEEYSGNFNCIDRDTMPEPELSALPSDSTEEDGKALLADIELCGAEVVAWDYFTGKPMLVRYKLGKGYVYTFTLWAYPGHEKFQSFCASFIAKLSSETLDDVYVKDDTNEVFWSVWDDAGRKKVMLINTDWTKKGNVKTVTLVENGKEHVIKVPEREFVMVSLDEDVKVENFTL